MRFGGRARGAGVLWRKAWFACLVYERTRYALRHPESRLPGYTLPVRRRAPDDQQLRQPGRPPARPPGARSEPVRGERGQASVEFVALVSLCCLAFGALLALAGRLRRARCRRLPGAPPGLRGHRPLRPRRARLVAAYGERDAATVRALAPNLVYEPGERELPVDWRELPPGELLRGAGRPRARRARAAGHGRPPARATAFTHVIRRGGRLYIQYWLYYPDSNTTLAGSDRIWERSAAAARLCAARRLSRLPPGRLGGRLRPRRPRRQRLAPRQLARPLPGLQVARLPRRAGSRHAAGCGSRAAATPATCRSAASRAAGAPGRAPPAPRPAPARSAAPHADAGPGAASASAAPRARACGSSRSSRSTRAITFRWIRDVLPPWDKDAYLDPEADDVMRGANGRFGLGWSYVDSCGPAFAPAASRGSASQ